MGGRGGKKRQCGWGKIRKLTTGILVLGEDWRGAGELEVGWAEAQCWYKVLAATIAVRSPGHSWHQELQLPSLPAASIAAASSTQSKICLETPASCNMYFHLMFPGCIQDKAFLLKKHQNAIMKSKYSLIGFAVQALKALSTRDSSHWI